MARYDLECGEAEIKIGHDQMFGEGSRPNADRMFSTEAGRPGKNHLPCIRLKWNLLANNANQKMNYKWCVRNEFLNLNLKARKPMKSVNEAKRVEKRSYYIKLRHEKPNVAK